MEMMWDEIDALRNEIAGYDEPVKLKPNDRKSKQRECSRKCMRRLYDARRKAGLNAHGKPFAVKK